MSKMRHGKKSGGEVYAGADSNVVKEAEEGKEKEEKSSGGRAGRKRGGHVDGEKAKMRLDRPGRKRGGRTMSAGGNSDKSPFTAAENTKDGSEHKTTDDGMEKVGSAGVPF